MCRPAYYDPVYFKKVYQNTVELIADLFLNFIGVLLITENNLMSHAEVSVKWKETDHTDPNAYFMEYGKSMDIFRRDVQDRIDEERGTMSRVEKMEKRLSALENKMIYNYIDSNMPQWARPTIQKLVDRGYLKGNENNELGLSDEMIRIYVVLDRAGLF